MPDAVRVHEDTPNIFAFQPLLKGPGLEDPRPREALRIACVWTSENRVVYSQSPGSLVTVSWERASWSTFLPAALSTVNPLSLP